MKILNTAETLAVSGGKHRPIVHNDSHNTSTTTNNNTTSNSTSTTTNTSTTTWNVTQSGGTNTIGNDIEQEFNSSHKVVNNFG